jgi:hypothetical protein
MGSARGLARLGVRRDTGGGFAALANLAIRLPGVTPGGIYCEALRRVRSEGEISMALPSLVLVHGALHAGDCWDLTVAAINRLDPELVVLAVDLPGRRDRAGDLITASIDE